MNGPNSSRNGNASEHEQEASMKHRTEGRFQECLRLPAENARSRLVGIIIFKGFRFEAIS